MKIGDKIRFLNEVGGGVVVGFQSHDVAIIRDEDGFEIPTLVRECVVVETDEYNIPKHEPAPAPHADNRFRGKQAVNEAHSFDDDEDTKPVTFKAPPLERRGADVLQLFLAFVPLSPEHLVESAFLLYVVNDSNYYVRFALYVRGEEDCELRHEDEVEPNSKLLLEDLDHSALSVLPMLALQAFAYKRGKLYAPKPVYDVPLHIDARKFYRRNAFAPNDFFEQPALLVPAVRNDKAARSLPVDAKALQDALSGAAHAPKAEERPRRTPARKEQKKERNALIEVDLHASELLDTLSGLQPRDILEYQLKTFRETMEAHRHERGRKIVFIHGKGEGVLRNALIKELKAHYKGCQWQDASFQEYGYGATMVTIG